MRSILFAGAALLMSGCALFGGGDESLAAANPVPDRNAGAAPVRAAFRPAYATGAPTALVPCRETQATINGDCAAGEPRHQLRAEGDSDEARPSLTDVSLAPATPVSR
jgi:hypothetical protein